MTDATKLLNTQQVADRLNVTDHTIRMWRSKGIIPAHIAEGKVHRYIWDDVKAALDKRQRKQLAKAG